MIQNLLKERLRLVVHREDRDVPTYEVKIAKGGPKLRRPEKAAAQPDGTGAPAMTRDKDGQPTLPSGATGSANFMLPDGNTRISARNIRLADLLPMMGRFAGRPVIDKTGLDARYDFDLTFYPPPDLRPPVTPGSTEAAAAQPGAAEAASEPRQDLAAALDTQLGLRLVPSKGPVRVLVVDTVHRTPTAD